MMGRQTDSQVMALCPLLEFHNKIVVVSCINVIDGQQLKDKEK